jgi:hypothetical protein
MSTEMNQARANIHAAQGSLNYSLEIFGDELAKREGYKAHDGLEAIQYYLMQKHGWLPRDLKTMSLEDLRFALAEELHGWTLPKNARGHYKLG